MGGTGRRRWSRSLVGLVFPHVPVPRELVSVGHSVQQVLDTGNEAVIMLQPFSLALSAGGRGKDPFSQLSEGTTWKHKVEITAPQPVSSLLRVMKTNSEISSRCPT